jgi:XTP/dITP diphosphohydrolase
MATIIVFATNNVHKLSEVTDMLGNSFDVKSLKDIDCFDVLPEEQQTLEGNALQKARYVYDLYHVNCFADDTGLEVEALDGEPGVYSARYAGEACIAANNMDKLLEKLKGITNRKARFRTVIALILDGKEYLFEGVVNGTILTARRGEEGFGYDPIFQPEGYSQSFGEMESMVKNSISHRALAVSNLVAYLKEK